ncbi:MAG: IclR family transcriptional regulator [Proteobacteria bacterium]|nr:IclR family transcriptional regulator [Pseudomonadota bacterium]
MDNNRGKNSFYFLKSLATGLTVLQTMAEASRPMSLTELSRAVGTNNATTTRCCYTLSQMGFVHRDAQRRFYLAPKALLLGYAAVSRLGWRNVAREYMEALNKDIRETINLSILEGVEILYIIRIKTEKILSYDLQIGSRLPLYCTSMGKSLMAFTPPDQVRRIFKDIEFKPLTHRTITNLEDYLRELEEVRRKGYSINDEELSVGLRSVAAPIPDREGRAMAALNIAVPTKRVSREELEAHLAPRAMETARRIQEAVAALE